MILDAIGRKGLRAMVLRHVVGDRPMAGLQILILAI